LFSSVGTLSALETFSTSRFYRDSIELPTGDMMDRQATFLWMQDLLERLAERQQQWRSEPGCDQYLGASMCRDLDELRRLCDWLRRKSDDASSAREHAAAAA
jgi:hypothetical protein